MYALDSACLKTESSSTPKKSLFIIVITTTVAITIIIIMPTLIIAVKIRSLSEVGVHTTAPSDVASCSDCPLVDSVAGFPWLNFCISSLMSFVFS